MIRWATIILSVAGLAIGVWAVSTADEKPVQLPLARPASVNPFDRGVAALGFVEPTDREVAIIAPEPGQVTDVYVNVGDVVAPGAPLFKLDTRKLESDLLRAEAAVPGAQAEVARWHALPRAEDVPPLQAAVDRAAVLLKDRQDFLRLTRDAFAKSSGSQRDVDGALFSVDAAKAELARVTGELVKVQSGGWEPDLKLAEATLAQRQADVAALRVQIDRMTVRAPHAGTILRRELEPGEYASIDSRVSTLILGNLTHLGVRAQVDEEDIGLVKPGAKAIARTRGEVVEEIPLTLIRIEPYARPKTDLNGSNMERVDTRVVDVVFALAHAPQVSIYTGQAVDVFIDASR